MLAKEAGGIPLAAHGAAELRQVVGTIGPGHAIRDGIINSTKDLIQRTDNLDEQYSTDASPFMRATAQSMLARLETPGTLTSGATSTATAVTTVLSSQSPSQPSILILIAVDEVTHHSPMDYSAPAPLP